MSDICLVIKAGFTQTRVSPFSDLIELGFKYGLGVSSSLFIYTPSYLAFQCRISTIKSNMATALFLSEFSNKSSCILYESFIVFPIIKNRLSRKNKKTKINMIDFLICTLFYLYYKLY